MIQESATLDDSGVIIISTTTQSPESPNQDSLNEVSLGLVVPLVAISLGMLVVGACLVYHSWRRQRGRKTRGQYEVSHLDSILSSSLHRGPTYTAWDDLRSSTRSATPLRGVTESQRDVSMASNFRPGRLGKISESPEDRIAQLKQKGRKPTTKSTTGPEDKEDGFNCDDSILSMISKWKADLEVPAISGSLPNYLDGPHYNLNTEISQSYPNLILPAQAPFSPYRLTWVSPSTNRVIQSEPAIVNNYQSGLHALVRRLSSVGASSDVSSNRLRNHYSTGSGKSPYHPNYNTPTGSETDANQVPSNTIINPPNSINNQENDLQSLQNASCPTVTHQSGVNVNQFQGTPVPCCPEMNQYLSGTTAHVMSVQAGSEGSMTLSCPSNVGSWHYNQIYNHPCEICKESGRKAWPRLVHPLAASCDSANVYEQCQSGLTSADTSVCPLMGSSGNTSIVHPGGRLSLPYLINTSFNNSGSGTAMQVQSRSTSVCGHMDSCESSQTGSNITTAANNSGYQGSVSHSTSVTGNNSGFQGSVSHSTSVTGNHTTSEVNTSTEPNTTSEASAASTTIQGLSSIRAPPGNVSGILGPVTPSTQQGDSTGLTSDTTNSFYNTAHSAPAAYASFHMPSVRGQEVVGPKLSDTDNRRDNIALEWDAFVENSLARSISSQRSRLQSAGTSATDEVFSPISKTDSSLRSVSLSPFRLAALAAQSGRFAIMSAGSVSNEYHWDTSYDPYDNSHSSGNNQSQATENEGSNSGQHGLPLYPSALPVLSEDQFWV